MPNFNPLGLFQTEFLPDTLRTDSFADTILRLAPNGNSPIFGLTGEFNRATALSPEHGYHQKRMPFEDLTIDEASDYVAGDTTLVVDDVDGCVPGMVYQVPSTREQIRVLTVASATSVTVARGVGRVAAGAILDNEVLFAIGTSYERASQRPSARSIPPIYRPNYTVIVRNAWALSDTDRATMTEDGWNNVGENRQDGMLLHAKDIEGWIIFGQPKAPTASPNGPLQSQTQGIEDSIYQYAPAANVTVAGSTTTYEQLRTAVTPAFELDSDMTGRGQRVAFLDSLGMQVIHDIGRLYGEIQMMLGSNTFGMNFTKFVTHKGTIMLKEHPLFNGMVGAGLPNGKMLVVDILSIRLAYMKGRDLVMDEFDNKKQHTNNGIDAIGGSLITEFAVEPRNPDGCCIMEGLTAAA